MGKQPARKILGVLSRQKPQKSRRVAKSRITPIRLGLIGVLGIFVLAFIYFNAPIQPFQAAHRSKVALKQKNALNWKIVIRTTDDRPLSDNQMSNVVNLVRSKVISGNRSELQDASKLVVQKMSLGTASITRAGAKGLVVSVSQRVPLLGVLADKSRFLTADGVVFGDITADAEVAQTIGPVISGIFDHRSESFSWNENGTLEVSDEEKELLKESAELYRAIRTTNHKVKSLEFKRFRGFFAILEDSETEVALGRSPFDGKLARLHEILVRLEKTSSTAARIELDYQGKAFIKEKKL